ncbi:hypothetical protein J4466_02595 [Candidatus Pacearchaeota archaeon]|nr:hypothetical protein [Candidatus Pacearchaeota archaeon]
MDGIYKTIASYLALGTMALYSGCATTGPNIAKTVGNALLIPGRMIESTVKELDPTKGLRRGIVNTGEAVYDTVRGGEAVDPAELGRTNGTIEDRPVLEAIVDISASAGLGAGITRIKPNTWTKAGQVATSAAIGETVIKAGNAHKNK